MRNIVSNIHVMNVYYVVKYAIVLMIIHYILADHDQWLQGLCLGE